MSRVNHAIVVGVLLSLAGDARASGPPRVSWSGDASCSRPADLLGRIATAIGTTSGDLAGRLVAFDAAITRPAASGSTAWRMHLRLKTASGGGERTFSAQTCEQLVEGAVLIAALAIDPDAVRAHKGRARKKKQQPRRQVQLGLRALSRVDLGVLADAGVSFGLAAAVLWPALRLELDLSHGLPVGSVVQNGGAGADLRLPIAGGVRGCWRRPIVERLELDLCVGAMVGWLHGEGTNIAEPRSGGSFWGAALGGGALSLAITRRWWVRLEGRGGASFARASFEIEGVGQVHQAPILVGQVGAGIEGRLF